MFSPIFLVEVADDRQPEEFDLVIGVICLVYVT